MHPASFPFCYLMLIISFSLLYGLFFVVLRIDHWEKRVITSLPFL